MRLHLLVICALAVGLTACGTSGSSRSVDDDTDVELLDGGGDTAEEDAGDASEDPTDDPEEDPDPDVREDPDVADVAPDVQDVRPDTPDTTVDTTPDAADVEPDVPDVGPTACETAVDCVGGQTCYAGNCVGICSPVIACEDNDLNCVEELGVCLECVRDGQCGDGEACVDNRCTSFECEAGDPDCADPCMEVSTTRVGFGPTPISATARRTVTVSYCREVERGRALEVDEIELRASAGGAFAVDAGTPPSLLPGESWSFEVTFVPDAVEMYEGEVVVHSNDPGATERSITLTGGGSMNDCPVALASCSFENGSQVGMTGDTVFCSADGSNDTDGDVVSYRWRFVESPGPPPFFNPSAMRPDVSAQVLNPGRYVIGLTVTDDEGADSCEEAQVALQVEGEEAQDSLTLILTWDTPGDDDPTNTGIGAGADMDIHLLHPSGWWRDMRWDCHWGAISPMWTSNPSFGNPRLTVDDTDGWGPEVIEFERPERGVPYRLGVHYWDDHNYGPSTATVRVLWNGEEIGTYEEDLIARENFWQVVSIEVPPGEITAGNPVELIPFTDGVTDMIPPRP